MQPGTPTYTGIATSETCLLRQSDVDECVRLLEVTDDQVGKIDAQIEAEVMRESESNSERQLAVEYVLPRWGVTIVKHLLVTKHVQPPVKNAVMLRRARQRARSLGIARKRRLAVMPWRKHPLAFETHLASNICA